MQEYHPHHVAQSNVITSSNNVAANSDLHNEALTDQHNNIDDQSSSCRNSSASSSSSPINSSEMPTTSGLPANIPCPTSPPNSVNGSSTMLPHLTPFDASSSVDCPVPPDAVSYYAQQPYTTYDPASAALLQNPDYLAFLFTQLGIANNYNNTFNHVHQTGYPAAAPLLSAPCYASNSTLNEDVPPLASSSLVPNYAVSSTCEAELYPMESNATVSSDRSAGLDCPDSSIQRQPTTGRSSPITGEYPPIACNPAENGTGIIHQNVDPAYQQASPYYYYPSVDQLQPQTQAFYPGAWPLAGGFPAAILASRLLMQQSQSNNGWPHTAAAANRCISQANSRPASPCWPGPQVFNAYATAAAAYHNANVNPTELDGSLLVNCRYFVIKSNCEYNVLQSIRYEVWCSTKTGNKHLKEAYDSLHRRSLACLNNNASRYPQLPFLQNWVSQGHGEVHSRIILLFCVSSTNRLSGIAEMVSSVNLNETLPIWQENRFRGSFKVKWLYIKAVPSSVLSQIEAKYKHDPVTRLRDVTEIQPRSMGAELVSLMHYF